MSPGERVGELVKHGIDAHFNTEIAAYCERHFTKPEELEVNISPGKKDELWLVLGHHDPRLIFPKRRFTLTIKLSDAK